MKKLLHLLLCLPLIGFGQGTINCTLLTITDVVIDNTNLTVDIAIYNGNTMDTHYPHIAYTIDNNGDTIQNGDVNWFMTFALDTSWYSYTLSNAISPSFPLTLYFVYDNLGGLGWDTCMLIYNSISTELFNLDNVINRKLVIITDILGRETKGTKNQPLFYIYDDGTVEKRIVIE